MTGVSVHIPAQAMKLTAFDRAEMKATRMKARVYDILNTASRQPADRYGKPTSQEGHTTHTRLDMSVMFVRAA